MWSISFPTIALITRKVNITSKILSLHLNVNLGVSVVLERGPERVEGEWEDGSNFTYDVASWEQIALGYEGEEDWGT